MLSNNKSNFLKTHYTTSQTPSMQLAASEIDAVVNHYYIKHGIFILKNGCTELGKQFIAKNQEKIRQRWQDKIAEHQDHARKYYLYATNGFMHNGTEHALSQREIGQENMDLLKNLLKDYLNTNEDGLKENLSSLEQNQINQLVAEHLQARTILDNQITYSISLWEKKQRAQIENCCLSKEEVWQEIAYIQAILMPDQFVGYVFTNGSQIEPKHFEAIIIARDLVIKPLFWSTSDGVFTKSPTMKLAEINFKAPILQKSRRDPLPAPQTGWVECGMLSILYLKELLKNNAEQIKNYSLTFPLCDKEGVVRYFFYPSPHVLRYSQSSRQNKCYFPSSRYNELIAAMLTDSAEYQYSGDKVYQIMTLKTLLKNSQINARKHQKTEIAQDNEKILNSLDSFKLKWLEEYTKTQAVRDRMQGSQYNCYLSYATHRLKSHAMNPTSKETWDQLSHSFVSAIKDKENRKPTVKRSCTSALSLENQLYPVQKKRSLSSTTFSNSENASKQSENTVSTINGLSTL